MQTDIKYPKKKYIYLLSEKENSFVLQFKFYNCIYKNLNLIFNIYIYLIYLIIIFYHLSSKGISKCYV